VDTIKVYCLPFGLKTRGSLTADDVRDFNNDKNHYLEITEDTALAKFERALVIYNLQDSNRVQYDETNRNYLIDVRMVLDFIHPDGSILTVEIGAPTVYGSIRRQVRIVECYFSNIKPMNQAIDECIPEKLLLNGDQ